MNALAKYRRRVARVDSLLCVGLDSRLERIPERFRQEELPLLAFHAHHQGEVRACAPVKGLVAKRLANEIGQRIPLVQALNRAVAGKLVGVDEATPR